MLRMLENIFSYNLIHASMSRVSLFLFYAVSYARYPFSYYLLEVIPPYSFLPLKRGGGKNSGAISKEIVEPLETLSALSLEESLYLLLSRIFLKTKKVALSIVKSSIRKEEEKEKGKTISLLSALKQKSSLIVV